MEVRYQMEGQTEETVLGVDFVNVYPFNNTIFIRYIKADKPGELVIDLIHLKYFKIYKD